MWAEANQAKILLNEQITKLKTVDVILRDPVSRLVSGINTYIQLVLRDHPALDSNTVTWFALNHFWLNNHYASQFSWLVSLARYLDPATLITFRSMSAIQSMIHNHIVPIGISPPIPELIEKIKQANHWEMYQRLDQCLLQLIDQSVTWIETLDYVKQRDPSAWAYVVDYAKKVIDPLYVLS